MYGRCQFLEPRSIAWCGATLCRILNIFKELPNWLYYTGRAPGLLGKSDQALRCKNLVFTELGSAQQLGIEIHTHPALLGR